jgi:hypothetical protein
VYDFLDNLVAFLDLAGELLSDHPSRATTLARGTRLQARRQLDLVGRDRRPNDAEAFVIRLPRGAHCRVERLGASVWVEPLDSDIASLVPAECRAAARAYGFLLEVAPRSLEEDFRRVPGKRVAVRV